MSKRVLCLLAPGFEEIETVTPIDLLCRAGAEVVLAALGDDKEVTGRSGITIHAQITLGETGHEGFDLLLVPGGPGVEALRSDGRPARLAQSFAEAGKTVAAICAAPTVLHDAGLLEGRRYTAHFSVHGELKRAEGSERVIEDGKLITSRGAGTALDFGLQIIRHLYGDEEANKIATAIMA